MSLSKLHTVLLACLIALLTAPAANAFAPLQMGIHDPGSGDGAAGPFDRMNDAGASIVRTAVLWRDIAPGGVAKPSGFDARNPADPAYNWTALDAFVRAANARGMEPLITTYGAPEWAEGDNDADRAKRFGDAGTYHPNASDYGDFMQALATRYSGKFSDLPRVKLFQVWNEPNFGQYLTSKTKTEIPVYYAKLLNAAYGSVKGVSGSNLVIAGGLGPYGNNGHATDVDPQVFMRELMCLSGKGGRNLGKASRCNVPTPKFDVWAQHPYSFGGTPTTSAYSVDGAAVGDMDDVKRTLDFAVRKRAVAPRGSKRLWVTEFAWFSNPPGLTSGDGRQLGLALPVQAAYLSESAYRLWRLGFSAFVWYSLEDLNGFPSGLYLGHDATLQAKPALTAFKFPFYAERSGSKVLVWGLVSRGGRTTVRIEKQSGSAWKTVADIRSDQQGMIYKRLTGGKGTYRARALDGGKAGLQSLAFKAR